MAVHCHDRYQEGCDDVGNHTVISAGKCIEQGVYLGPFRFNEKPKQENYVEIRSLEHCQPQISGLCLCISD